jgi:hypothetical protein
VRTRFHASTRPSADIFAGFRTCARYVTPRAITGSSAGEAAEARYRRAKRALIEDPTCWAALSAAQYVAVLATEEGAAQRNQRLIRETA